MLSLILTLLAASPAEAKLPKLGFAANEIHCSIQWASPTSYQPEGVKATKPFAIKPNWEGGPVYEQEIVRNTDPEILPLWNGGIIVREYSSTAVLVGLYFKNNKADPFGSHVKIADVMMVLPANSRAFPGLTLSARVAPADERHGSERDWITVELSCFSKR